MIFISVVHAYCHKLFYRSNYQWLSTVWVLFYNYRLFDLNPSSGRKLANSNNTQNPFKNLGKINQLIN